MAKQKTVSAAGLTHGHHKSILVVTILLALIVGVFIGGNLYNNLGIGIDVSALNFGLLFTNTVILIMLTAVIIRHHSKI